MMEYGQFPATHYVQSNNENKSFTVLYSDQPPSDYERMHTVQRYPGKIFVLTGVLGSVDVLFDLCRISIRHNFLGEISRAEGLA